MTKKARNTLTDLLQEVNVANLKEPEGEDKPTPPDKAKKAPKIPKITNKNQPENQTILDKLKAESPIKNTRITIDLDPETYTQLKELVSYTGKTQAKLIRALISETAKLLQKMQ